MGDLAGNIFSSEGYSGKGFNGKGWSMGKETYFDKATGKLNTNYFAEAGANRYASVRGMQLQMQTL